MQTLEVEGVLDRTNEVQNDRQDETLDLVVGRNLHTLRTGRNASLDDLARAIGVSRTERFGVESTVRASFAPYNTVEDVGILVEVVQGG